MIKVIKLGDVITKTITIPVASVTSHVSGITSTITVPSGWAIQSAVASIGTLVGNVWTIPVLPANTSGILDLTLVATDECPSGYELAVAISADNGNCNLTNDVAVSELLFLTCCELAGCDVKSTLLNHECYDVPVGFDLLAIAGPFEGEVVFAPDSYVKFTSPASENTLDTITFNVRAASATTTFISIFSGHPAAGGTLVATSGASPIGTSSSDVLFTFTGLVLDPNTDYYVGGFSGGDVTITTTTVPSDFYIVENDTDISVAGISPIISYTTSEAPSGSTVVYNVFTLEVDGELVQYAVNPLDLDDRIPLEDGVPSDWKPCPGRGVSEDADNSLTVGSDGLPYYNDVDQNPHVSADANNDLSVGLDGGAYYNAPAHTPSTITNTDGVYTHDNGDGVTQEIGYLFDDTHVGTDGLVDFVDLEGNVVDQLDLCGANCPPDTVVAVSQSFEINSCTPFSGNLANDSGVTPCSNGPSIYTAIPNTAVGGTVIVSSNGEFEFTPTDCEDTPLNGWFYYTITCTDGTSSSAQAVVSQPVWPPVAPVDDQFASPSNTALVGSVATNETDACPDGGVKTFSIDSIPNGAITMAPDGTFTFNPNTDFEGMTVGTVNVYCNGFLVGTQALEILVIKAEAVDDRVVGVQNTPFSGPDATLNDDFCTSPAVTTFQWKDTNTAFGGTVTGDPMNTIYTAPANFCGIDAATYELLCDGAVFGEATMYFNTSCANAIPDTFISGDPSTPDIFNVSDNDVLCTNGGVTTFHLVMDETIDGTTEQGLVDCTTGDPLLGFGLSSWNQTTGEVTLKVGPGVYGSACFKYFIRCTSDFGTYDTTPTTVTYTVPAPIPTAFVEVGASNDSNFPVTLGAKLTSNGVDTPLPDGEVLHITIPEIGVDVELLVGQDPSTPSGIQNDVGITSWADIVSASSGFGVMNGADLLTNNYSFVFDKYQLAFNAGLVGIDVGNTYTVNNEVQYSTLSSTDTSIIPIQYISMEVHTSGAQSPSGDALCGVKNIDFLRVVGNDRVSPADLVSNTTISFVQLEVDGVATPAPSYGYLPPSSLGPQYASCLPSGTDWASYSATFVVDSLYPYWASPMTGTPLRSNTYHKVPNGGFQALRGNMGNMVITPNERKNFPVHMFLRRIANTGTLDPIKEVNYYISDTPNGNPLSGTKLQSTSWSDTSQTDQSVYVDFPTRNFDGVFPWYSELVLDNGEILSSQEGIILFVSY